MDWPLFFIGFACGAFVAAYALRFEFRDRVNTALKNFFLGAVRGSGKKRPKAINGKKEKQTKQQKCLICRKWGDEIDMIPVKADNGKKIGWMHPSCENHRDVEERQDTVSYREE